MSPDRTVAVLSGRRSTRRRGGLALLAALLLAGYIGSTGGVAAAEEPAALPTDASRSHPSGLISRNVYDYAPSVMADGTYRMWWCSQNVSSQTFHQIPYGASLHTGAPAISAAGRPAGYVLDDAGSGP